MNCERWRIEIAAFLDGSSDPRITSKLRNHLDTCSSCLDFYREQSELNALLGSAALEVEPPEYLWYQIENRIPRREVPAARNFLADLLGFWSVPRLRYALVSSLLLLVVSWSLLQVRSHRAADQAMLARIDAYQMKVVEGNPFLPNVGKPVSADNPFFSLSTANSNPFQSMGSLQ